MSVDLEWDVLDDALAQSLLAALNNQLASVTRPSFVGPVEVVAFDFGTVAPELEVVDLRDIYRDFLEADEQDEAEQQRVDADIDEDDDGFEWVSRRSIPPEADGHGIGPAYHALPPHIRYGGHGGSPVTDLFSSLPSLQTNRASWGAVPLGTSPLSASILDGFPRRPLGTHSVGLSAASRPSSFLHSPMIISGPSSSSDSSLSSAPPPSYRPPPDPPAPTSANPHPNLQMHMHVHWPSDLRITLKTSLLINYPSPSFLALPIKLSITGLVFDGEIAIAYEGARRRAHLCILDALDPYGPLGNSRRTPLARTSTSSSLTSLSSDHPDHLNHHHGHDHNESDEDSEGDEHDRPAPGSKPPPVGQRLLPTICIESEIGSADRHVLKNVGRVERFVQDVLRKTVEDELVFPNFHTIVLGDA
jgi:distribution and morphology protein 12